MRRILFFAEAVTLAHVARPIVLANSLLGRGYEPVMACSSLYKRFTATQAWQTLPLNSISSQQFLRNLARGAPVYDLPTLRRYVAEDIDLIERVKPDFIVGDFRLSLSVSARLMGIPYATITNAYWSPYARNKAFPMPVLPFTPYLPLSLAQSIFDSAKLLAFNLHCRPLNRVRTEHSLPTFGRDLRLAYTDSDYTLYADIPAMFPADNLPANHRFLGPILWSPQVSTPSWWNSLPKDKPIVYVTLGSSGSPQILKIVIAALADQPVTIIASTAGAPLPPVPSQDIYIADYLPGNEAAARANLVICNGGSPTSQQALACGVPVLGIASNMDQFMNMAAVVRSGAGTLLRADRVNRQVVGNEVSRLLADPDCRRHAMQLAQSFNELNSKQIFGDFVNDIFSKKMLSPQAS